MADPMAPGWLQTAKALGALGFRGGVVDVLRAAEPPARCPTCGHPALDPVRDDKGYWTWACHEGCNP